MSDIEITTAMKAACIGEHKLIVQEYCPYCTEDEIDHDCHVCDGTYQYEVAYVIPWHLQKQIYKDMVKAKEQP